MRAFEGKVVLVSGSTRGLGYETALALAKLGAYVYINGRREKDVEATVKKIKELARNENVFAVRGDISKDRDVEHMIEKIAKRHGRLDFLVNNAGQYISQYFLKSDYADIIKTIQTNLLGHIHLALLAAKLMNKNGFGRIVNVSSGSGLHGGTLPSFGYALSKNGMIFMSKSLNKELEKHNIKINTVVIRFMETEMLHVYKKYYKKVVKRELAWNKALPPAYVAKRIIKLLNPKSGGFGGRQISIK